MENAIDVCQVLRKLKVIKDMPSKMVSYQIDQLIKALSTQLTTNMYENMPRVESLDGLMSQITYGDDDE